MVGLAGQLRQAQVSQIGQRLFRPEFALLAAVFALQIPLILNADLGWLLTVCEKMLAGDRLGVDVVELNPPLSVLMYMPAAYLGTILPLPAHIAVIALVLALAWASMRLTQRALIPQFADAATERRAGLLILAILTLAPGPTFGQRDHIAVLCLVPFIALCASAEPSARPRPLWLSVAAGFGAGLAMSTKPHFALPAGLALLCKAVRQKDWRVMFGLECWIAGGVVILYYGAVFLIYPEYFSTYPRLAALAYMPLRKPLGSYFGIDTVGSLFCLSTLLVLTHKDDRQGWHAAAPWLLAAVGSFLAYVIQGKGFAYMRLPAVTFVMLGTLLAPFCLSARFWNPDNRMRAILIGLGAIGLAAWLVPGSNSFAELRGPIRAAAPPNPSILAITSNVAVGEPLVRKLNGQWASGAGSQLLAGGALARLQSGQFSQGDKLALMQIIAQDRQRLRTDLEVCRPDVLLIDSQNLGADFDWEAWARGDPRIDRTLDSNYRFVTRRKGVSVWVRR